MTTATHQLVVVPNIGRSQRPRTSTPTTLHLVEIKHAYRHLRHGKGSNDPSNHDHVHAHRQVRTPGRQRWLSRSVATGMR
jgi:hypothetical protein